MSCNNAGRSGERNHAASRVYDEAGNVIDTHERAGELQSNVSRPSEGERCYEIVGHGAGGLVGQAMRCFNVPFILPTVVVAAVKCVAAQTAIPLVDIKSVDPTIVIELRYAGANNLAGRALYPPRTPALVRPEVASHLAATQAFLRRYQYGLKIWDAYRPRSVQMQLRQAAHNNDYVADPQAGAGSLHSWGVAVDATLMDMWNRPVLMPTDFDDFTPDAMWIYRGADPAIRSHLHLLQVAMRDAGFYGLPTEWWHFVIVDWQKYLPPVESKRALQVAAARP